MSYYLRQGNIVNVATDAIVNAANTELTRTPGICEAIFSAADTVKLEQAMARAQACNCKSIAFPLIFSGEYHIPREEAIRIAGKAISDFVDRHPELDVVLVLYKPGIYAMAKRILAWSETDKYEPDAK